MRTLLLTRTFAARLGTRDGCALTSAQPTLSHREPTGRGQGEGLDVASSLAVIGLGARNPRARESVLNCFEPPLPPTHLPRACERAYDAPVNLFAPESRRRLLLKPGKERVIANRHPWIFAGAIANESGNADAAVADLVDKDGNVLASGFYSRPSQIRLPALPFRGEALTEELFRARVDAAFARRTFEHGNAARLVSSEGDDLSGLVIDLYDDLAVVEIANRGLDLVRELVVDALRARGVHLIYFKNDIPSRKLEQISMITESLCGGDATAPHVVNG